VTAADLFGPDWISSWVTGTALVLLAGWLYVLDVGNAARRVFALLLLFRGITFFIAPLRFEAASASESVLWANLAPYYVLPLVALVVAFLSLYPRRRGLGAQWWGLPALLVLTVALEAWYLLDHAVYAKVSFTAPASYTELGPLFIFTGLRLPAFASAGLILVKDYRQAPLGSAGFSLFLIVAAFTLNGLFDGTAALLDLADRLRDPATIWWPWGWTRWWPPVLALPISLAACIRLIPVLNIARSNPELQEISRFFFAAVPLAVLSPFVRLLPYGGAEDASTFILAIWRLAIPFLIAYALLRYQLFDIDIRLKDGVRRAIIVVAFTVTFFLVSEAAESLLEGDRGPLFGIVAAGFLALGARPVKKFADRVADAFMPDTKPIAEQTYEERTAFYLEQYRLITTDGQVTPKERRMLGRLQRTLSLSDEAVFDLETVGQVQRPQESHLEAPLPAPVRAETKDSRLEVAIKAAVVAGAMALFFGMLSQGIEVFVPVSGTLAGLLSAALVAALLGPLETLADRLTHRIDPTAATEARDEKERRRAFEAALATALEDGSLSPRDLDYLKSLQGRLGISGPTRWRLERRARRRVTA
jgi:hypothetical protein